MARPNVVRRDHALDAAVVVENHHLCGVAERHVRGWIRERFRSAGLGGEVADVVARIFAADEFFELEVLRSAASCIAARCAAAQLSVVARDAQVSPHFAPSSLSQRTSMISGGSPVSSHTAWRMVVKSPWPISV